MGGHGRSVGGHWRPVRGPGRSVGAMGGHREVVEGQWEAIAISMSPAVKFSNNNEHL